MTLAVCIKCGTEKFGAWVPCPFCGFNPTTRIDRAKSLMLSDHHYPAEELRSFGMLIERGKQIAYDPINLAYCAESLADLEYFETNYDWEAGALACRRCGRRFKPELEEVLCPACCYEKHEILLVCEKCVKIFAGDARYCSHCGAILIGKPDLSSESIGWGLAVACRRAFNTRDIPANSKILAEIRDSIPPEGQRAIECELETFVMYVSTIAIREVTTHPSIGVRIVRAMLELYEKGWVLAGIDPAIARDMGTRCLRRFDEYDQAATAHPDKPEFWMATEAARTCFGLEQHLAATAEMMLVLGYLLRVFREYLNSTTVG